MEIMERYKEIKANNYCIQEVKCICNNCNNEFVEYTTVNYELVCFEDGVGKKYFLPTYGKYGYLDLMERLIEGWDSSERITKAVAEKFENKLNKITPYDVSLFQKIRCPKCKDTDISIFNRNNLLNYPVDWLKIDIEKI